MLTNFICPLPLLLCTVCTMGNKNYGNRKFPSFSQTLETVASDEMMENRRKKYHLSGMPYNLQSTYLSHIIHNLIKHSVFSSYSFSLSQC